MSDELYLDDPETGETYVFDRAALVEASWSGDESAINVLALAAEDGDPGAAHTLQVLGSLYQAREEGYDVSHILPAPPTGDHPSSAGNTDPAGGYKDIDSAVDAFFAEKHAGVSDAGS